MYPNPYNPYNQMAAAQDQAMANAMMAQGNYAAAAAYQHDANLERMGLPGNIPNVLPMAPAPVMIAGPPMIVPQPFNPYNQIAAAQDQAMANAMLAQGNYAAAAAYQNDANLERMGLPGNIPNVIPGAAVYPAPATVVIQQPTTYYY
eukprot:TRINITY_DN2125_c0_g4_i2.p1 TRINITY_DN2125_c0_g4~~TRINITY_DN2125_c0_g4_i2.p1  ORF type:complete len:147 (+),score=24.48 TRINITY_DN2125_c0_g4_i2:110-550(+)